MTLLCAGQRGWGSSEYIHTSQRLGGQLCQNHSVDDAVRACAKGPVLRGRTLRPPSHPKRRKRKKEGMWLTCQEDKEQYILPWGSRDVKQLSDAQLCVQLH